MDEPPADEVTMRTILGPMPGTPGTLSLESPINESTSTNWSGRSPSHSIAKSSSLYGTSEYLFTSSLFFLGGRNRINPGRNSWKKSLSGLATATAMPSSIARPASVPMISSASTPGTRTSVMSMARKSSWTTGTALMTSSGAGGRWPLYPRYSSCRNVFPDASKTTAKCVGCGESSSSDRTVDRNPNSTVVSLAGGVETEMSTE